MTEVVEVPGSPKILRDGAEAFGRLERYAWSLVRAGVCK